MELSGLEPDSFDPDSGLVPAAFEEEPLPPVAMADFLWSVE